MTSFENISFGLKKTKEKYPYKRAVVYPVKQDKQGRILYSQINFKNLDEESDKLAFGFEKIGIKQGVRTILMVKPGIEFFIICFAMFKTGAIPVVVDPGMGISRMLICLKQSYPKAFIGIKKAHILRIIKPKYFKSVKKFVTIGKKWFWGGYTLDKLFLQKKKPYPIAQTKKDDTAAIVFTTGSTGPAKGVIYTHGNFVAQIKQIQNHFKIENDEIDLPTFPLFALFDPCLGMTAIIPDMDPVKPALANPKKIIQAINEHGVTNMFASPALLNNLGKFGKENKIKLFSLRRVISAGAPVYPSNIEQFSLGLSKNTKIHTPYGATEAVPVISIESNEILKETKKLSEQGFGICIGRPICNTKVEIIKIINEAILRFDDEIKESQGKVGEIIVKAELVTKQYFNNPLQERLSKIPEADGTIWHRMGDLGWKDNKGRIWFCGRKSHRVILKNKTLFTIPVEAIFNNHKNVFRSALVGIGDRNNQIPIIFIEPICTISDEKVFIKELLSMADNPLTKDIKHILIKKNFPVDIRHNSKIFREKLAIIAEKKLKHLIKNKN